MKLSQKVALSIFAPKTKHESIVERSGPFKLVAFYGVPS